MSVHRINLPRLVGLLIVTSLSSAPSFGQEGTARPSADAWASKLLAGKFDAVQKMIKPHPGESRWMDISWQTSLWTARKMAAAEGKPIFVWNGSGGAPLCHT